MNNLLIFGTLFLLLWALTGWIGHTEKEINKEKEVQE